MGVGGGAGLSMESGERGMRWGGFNKKISTVAFFDLLTSFGCSAGRKEKLSGVAYALKNYPL